MYKYQIEFHDRKPLTIQASRVIPDKGLFMFYTYKPGTIFSATKLVASFPMERVKSVVCVDGGAH